MSATDQPSDHSPPPTVIDPPTTNGSPCADSTGDAGLSFTPVSPILETPAEVHQKDAMPIQAGAWKPETLAHPPFTVSLQDALQMLPLGNDPFIPPHSAEPAAGTDPVIPAPSVVITQEVIEEKALPEVIETPLTSALREVVIPEEPALSGGAAPVISDDPDMAPAADFEVFPLPEAPGGSSHEPIAEAVIPAPPWNSPKR